MGCVRGSGALENFAWSVCSNNPDGLSVPWPRIRALAPFVAAPRAAERMMQTIGLPAFELMEQPITCCVSGELAQVARREVNGMWCSAASWVVGQRCETDAQSLANSSEDESCVMALAVFDGGLDVMRKLVTISRSSLPGAVQGCEEGEPTHGRAALQHPPENAPAPHAKLRVLWDALDTWCALFARALHHEFAVLLSFAEIHDHQAVDAALQGLKGRISKGRVAIPGQVTVILPSGVFIAGVESNPKVLLWELHYHRTVIPPEPAAVATIDHKYFEPLQALRCGASGTARWWATAEARKLILCALSEVHFAIVDGFLRDEDWQQLAMDAKRLKSRSLLRLGRVEQKGTHGEYWGDDEINEADFLNTSNESHKWTVQGDHRRWLRDNDPLAPGLAKHTNELDVLLAVLRDDSHLQGTARRTPPPDPLHRSDAAGRLRRADFRESGMIACYPGDGGGRYHKHSDANRNAVLTALLYLNESWEPSDGGELRLYHEGLKNPHARYDVAPLRNRLLLFWSTDECPHEVLDVARDRYAVTVWVTDGRHALESPGGLAQLLKNLHVIAPWTIEEALCRAGAQEDQARRVGLVYEFYLKHHERALAAHRAGTEPSTEDEALARYLALQGLCHHCGELRPGEGKMGDGHYANAWFCQDCWESWDAG